MAFFFIYFFWIEQCIRSKNNVISYVKINNKHFEKTILHSFKYFELFLTGIHFVIIRTENVVLMFAFGCMGAWMVLAVYSSYLLLGLCQVSRVVGYPQSPRVPQPKFRFGYPKCCIMVRMEIWLNLKERSFLSSFKRFSHLKPLK